MYFLDDRNALDSSEIKILRVFEALEDNPSQTQRELSQRLNISLGLINLFINRLLRKGYFKADLISKKRIQYSLTPEGKAEKTRLAYLYNNYSIEFYKKARATFKALFAKLIEQGVNGVYFRGVSELTEIAYIVLLDSTLELAGVIDDKKAGKIFIKYKIMDSSVLDKIKENEVVIDTQMDSLHSMDIK